MFWWHDPEPKRYDIEGGVSVLVLDTCDETFYTLVRRRDDGQPEAESSAPSVRAGPSPSLSQGDFV